MTACGLEPGRRSGLHAQASHVRSIDLLQLSDQLARCQHRRGWFSLLCLVEVVNRFIAARLITTLLAATGVLIVGARLL